MTSRDGENSDPTTWPAHILGRAVTARTLSAVEVVTAFLDRIAQLDPVHHALVTVRPRDAVLADAVQRQAELDAGQSRGWLHGVPLAVKDLVDVRGMPTTQGFWRPDEAPIAASDSDFVPRLRAAGAMFVGKTNTPELGLGSHTYNAIAPTTRNALNPSLSAGGSSGGAAVAVATGMVPVADGSDFMGSLRNPPGWNGVFGLRPGAARPPTAEDLDVRGEGGADGPIARDAQDLALMLSTMQGTAPPPAPPGVGLRRVAWLGDLTGYLPTEPGLLDACHAGLALLATLGAEVADAVLPSSPGFTSVDQLWPTWLVFRQTAVGAELLEFAERHGVGDRLKPEARWEVEGFQSLRASDLQAMAAGRAGLAASFQALFEEFDVAVLPTAQVFPFPVAVHWPDRIDGRPMDTYHRWMEVTAPATLAGLPVLAVPVPTTGPPLGLQLIGPRGCESRLLRIADDWQRATSGSPGIALLASQN